MGAYSVSARRKYCYWLIEIASRAIFEGICLNSLELAHTVVEAIEEKMGESILLLDLKGISILADYYVIANGRSDRQLKALARAVTDLAGQKRNRRLRDLDEQATSGWVLVDLGEVIVHLFIGRQRGYYGLEKLWSHGKVLLRVQ